MSERMPVEPEKAALNPDDDALDEGDEKARYKKF